MLWTACWGHWLGTVSSLELLSHHQPIAKRESDNFSSTTARPWTLPTIPEFGRGPYENQELQAQPRTTWFQPSETLSRVSCHAVKLWDNAFILSCQVGSNLLHSNRKIIQEIFYRIIVIISGMPDQIHTPIVGILGIAVRVHLNSVCLYSYFFLSFQWWFSLVVFIICFLEELFPALCWVLCRIV